MPNIIESELRMTYKRVYMEKEIQPIVESTNNIHPTFKELYQNSVYA